MKKIISLTLTLLMLLASLLTLAACNEPEPEETVVIKIGYMQGPTGMGMAKLIADNGGINGNEKYQFVKYSDAKAANTALLSGEIDMACLPTNGAAALYNTQNGAVQALAINCLNSLFVMTKTGTVLNSFDDLEGATIYTISNGTPKLILEHVLAEKGINATVKTTATVNGQEKNLVEPSDLASAMIAGAVEIALVPEPVATSAPMNINQQGKDYNYTVAFDMTAIWKTVSDTPVAMGCIVGRTEFVKNNAKAVNAFLTEYKASIEYIANKANIDTAAQLVVDASVLGAVPAAKKSLTNLGSAIAYVDGDEMMEILESFYSVLDPSVIGKKMPDENFYYKK